MTSTLTSTDRYLAAYEQRQAADDQFAALRAEAYKRFESVGFPIARKGNERWKYTNIAPIARTEYQISESEIAPASIDDIKPARFRNFRIRVLMCHLCGTVEKCERTSAIEPKSPVVFGDPTTARWELTHKSRLCFKTPNPT